MQTTTTLFMSLTLLKTQCWTWHYSDEEEWKINSRLGLTAIAKYTFLEKRWVAMLSSEESVGILRIWKISLKNQWMKSHYNNKWTKSIKQRKGKRMQRRKTDGFPEKVLILAFISFSFMVSCCLRKTLWLNTAHIASHFRCSNLCMENCLQKVASNP